jgi:hypothetical protein
MVVKGSKLLVTGLCLFSLLLIAGCAEAELPPEGMESLRVLTDNEKDRVMEIALNTPEALSQLEKESIYETELFWAAIVWNNSQCSRLTALQLGDVEPTPRMLQGIPESAVFYPMVFIQFGEPPRWMVQIVVDLNSEKVVLTNEYPLRL